MKEAFEIWARTKELDLTPHPRPELHLYGADYWDSETQLCWECWKAARVVNVVSP